MNRFAFCVWLMLLTACTANTGGSAVEFELAVAGNTPSPIIAAANDWRVELERAELVFGPLWLCSAEGEQASCETARVEFLDAVRFDALDQEPQAAGVLSGTAGSVGTVWYDFGISSLLAQEAPFVSEAAKALGGSIALEGVATKDGAEVAFLALLPLAQQGADGSQGSPVIRRASADVAHTITDATTRLLVSFDATAWVRDVDFEPFKAEAVVAFEEGATPDKNQGISAIRMGASRSPAFRWSAE